MGYAPTAGLKRSLAALSLACLIFVPGRTLASDETVPPEPTVVQQSPADTPSATSDSSVAAPLPAPEPSVAPEPATESSAAPPPATQPSNATAGEPAPAEVHKVILLPVEFTVYEQSAGGGTEAVPDWTDAARRNLSASAEAVLQSRARLQLVAMPELTPDEAKVLHEHVGLARLVITQGRLLPGGPWNQRKADFDRGLGPGLEFLVQKTGAEYAVLLNGAQYKQSAGSVLSQLALAAMGVGVGGGGTFLSGSLIDLKHGEVAWFNTQMGMQILGMTGSDVRKSDSAESVLRKLFEPYPVIPALAR